MADNTGRSSCIDDRLSARLATGQGCSGQLQQLRRAFAVPCYASTGFKARGWSFFDRASTFVESSSPLDLVHSG